jgi:hypothetical protein
MCAIRISFIYLGSSEVHQVHHPEDEGMSIRLVEFTKTLDGNPQLSLTESGREGLPEFIEMRDQYGIDAAFFDLIAHQLGEGWEAIKPGEAGALTSSISLADAAGRDDLGVLTRCGRVYWHPSYAVEDPIETLQKSGHFFLTGAE